ncbi:hypothetical protein LTR08_007115 [Meristemomyces frigidus]|nr:hypothetical protein LTR08_007115 [Meristemomyces frigidus]
MADDGELKIKGAAAQPEQAEQNVATTPETPTGDSVAAETASVSAATALSRIEDATADATAEEEGSVPTDPETAETEDHQDQQQPPEYKWCKCYFEPEQPGAQNYYFTHFDTRESRYQEPSEPYWIWDAMLNDVHSSGLQQPSAEQQPPPAPGTSSEKPSSEADPNYEGYNPKIHGSYDANAPYAQYHKKKLAEAQAVQDHAAAATAVQSGDYGAVGAFNRFSGGFQTADKSTERHDDANKSGRQLNAFFDVDAAANSHDGKSLKEERRSQKLSKKEVAELSKKRRDKKEKKRMDFYKS